MKPPLVLIDGSSYFFRAFHALPPLMNSKGKPTGAIYGVANMVKRLIKDYPSSQIIVIFDAKGKTFRHEWFPEYKSHRPPMADDLRCQFEPLINLLKAMGLPLLIIEGVEADDVIGTLVNLAADQKIPVVISTGDKDMAQLVRENVDLINTMSNQYLNEKGVFEKFGVLPNQIIDYLALIGDSVDNIPGVPKCGPKTAVKWLQQYQTLENLLENASSITGKIGENLRESASYLPLSKKLVTLKKDVDLPFTLDQLVDKEPDKSTLISLIQDLEFKAWLKELLEVGDEEKNVSEQEKIEFSVINTLEQWDNLLTVLSTSQRFGIDVKTTTGLDFLESKLVGICLTIEGQGTYYISLSHQGESLQLSEELVLASLKPILENENIKKIGQNLKYCYAVFKNYSISLRGIVSDTMLISYLLNSSSNRHDIESLSLKYLGYKIIHFEEIIGKGAKQLQFDQISVEKVAPHAAENTNIIMQIHNTLYPQLPETVKTVLETIEVPLLTVLAEMEYEGVLIDLEALQKHGKRLKVRIAELEKEAIDLAGRTFNLNSPKQLQELLFDELKLPVISKTPKGQPSTAESVLQDLAYDYRLPALILEFRSLSKLVSTYIDALPKRINPKSGRVHTSYNQAIAATGRLSSSDPNLQNIPIRTTEGRLIRTAFIAPKGSRLLAFDYSQIELRIMAHLSKDEGLLTAFSNDWDIHAATASEIFQLPLDQVTHEQRRRAKAVNFGLIYGMSAFGLCKQLGIDRKEAQFYIDQYFKRYPGVLQYMEETRKKAHEQGFVETLFGRRLYLPEINVRNIARQRAAERMAINAPMQGTAADIIKKAMLSIAQWLTTSEINEVKMIMQVHDELVFEVKESAIEMVKEKIQQLMEEAVTLLVPLKVSVGLGLNWDEAH